MPLQLNALSLSRCLTRDRGSQHLPVSARRRSLLLRRLRAVLSTCRRALPLRRCFFNRPVWEPPRRALRSGSVP